MALRSMLIGFCFHAFLTVAPRGVVARDCRSCHDLVTIPAGMFVMGSPDDEPERESWQSGTESPAHTVSFRHSFEIAAAAVTVAHFRQFVVATGYTIEGGCHVFDGMDWRLDAAISWQAPGFTQSDDHPVVCLSWHDAIAYVAWLNAMAVPGSKHVRLPTEAEREYATRAGSTTPFWWGRTISPEDANYDTREVYAGHDVRAPYLGGTRPARAYAANPWGLYGVHGGVWEWMADCYSASHAGKSTTLRESGSVPRTDVGCDRRVLRGGAFNRHPRTLRAAYRTGLDPTFRGHSIGFRIAR
jgi:formylglycine-generating enzyme required for sulfatase activity